MNTGLYRLPSMDREKKTLCRAKRHRRSPDLMNTHRHSVTIFAVQIFLNVYKKSNIPPGTVHTTMWVSYIAKKGSRIITKETSAFRTKVSCFGSRTMQQDLEDAHPLLSLFQYSLGLTQRLTEMSTKNISWR
jgi:hypothetical protein